ncbi:hypothetical protein HYX13_02025 [Candidatus Woesearchaeota archaeon]|nr:hypothetical protein [Candidatus Woesearchaeota archaeon]
MSPLSLFRKKEPPQKPDFSAQEEEQRAAGFLNAIVQEQDIENVLKKVQDFQRLVIASPQKKKYNPEAVYHALGHRLFIHALTFFPDCLFGAKEYVFQPPSFSFESFGDADTSRLKVFQPLRYFEDALEETLLLWEEEVESREVFAFSKDKTKLYAREMARKAYSHAIQGVAEYIFRGCPSPAKSLDGALQKFEKIKYLYAINMPSASLPSVIVRDTQGNQHEEPLEKMVYLTALSQTKMKLEKLFGLPPEKFGSDVVLTLTEKMLDALEKYGKQECFSSEEQSNFQQQYVLQQERYVHTFLQAEKVICEEQDRIYGQWEKENLTANLFFLAKFTRFHSILLEETEKEVVLECKKKLERHRCYRKRH